MTEEKKEGFSLALALTDALPVILFSASIVLITLKYKSALFIIGAVLCASAGLGKVAWKMILALGGPDVKFLAKQFRFLMPSGFLLMIVSVILDRRAIDFFAVGRSVMSFPAAFFFGAWVLLIFYMIWLAKHMDQNDAKVNWKEQFVNSAAQLAFLLGILSCVLK
ncbi:MAG: hypothetical protein IKD81_04105 [Eubacteriaceae bacterium]|nr:hypothetical protein [Eubacteriaceae bacterium]